MNSLSICREILQKISKLIHSESFLESHRVKNRFIRKGLLTMTHIIVYLLYTSKQSMSINLSNIQLELPELKFPKVTKQAVSKARQGILPSLFKELFEISVDTYYNSIDHQKNRYRYQANKAYIIGRRKMFIARLGSLQVPAVFPYWTIYLKVRVLTDRRFNPADAIPEKRKQTPATGSTLIIANSFYKYRAPSQLILSNCSSCLNS